VTPIFCSLPWIMLRPHCNHVEVNFRSSLSNTRTLKVVNSRLKSLIQRGAERVYQGPWLIRTTTCGWPKTRTQAPGSSINSNTTTKSDRLNLNKETTLKTKLPKYNLSSKTNLNSHSNPRNCLLLRKWISRNP
jgi:hypothetical protein